MASTKTPEGRAKAVRYQMALCRKKMVLLRAYKAAHGCLVCGENDPIVLELHHRERGTKHVRLTKRRYGRAMQRTGGENWTRLSFVEIAVELEKCDVLCANCHRRQTHAERLLQMEGTTE